MIDYGLNDATCNVFEATAKQRFICIRSNFQQSSDHQVTIIESFVHSVFSFIPLPLWSNLSRIPDDYCFISWTVNCEQLSVVFVSRCFGANSCDEKTNFVSPRDWGLNPLRQEFSLGS